MRRAVLVLACVLIPALCWADAIRVQAGKTTRIPVPGATAAFSLNSVYAEATVEGDLVVVAGRQPGSTNIVVVTAVGTQTLEIVVVEAPPVFPPGFIGAGLVGSESEAAAYEFRYSSIPSQQQNVIDATQRADGRTFRFHLVNANLFQSDLEPGYSPVRFPSVFYEVKTAGREITFLDQYVVETPLTVENAVVRGLHVRDGSWTFHAGYSSMSAFQNLFLPTDREPVVGTTYTHRLDGRSRVAANFYAFPSRHAAPSGIPGGVVGSMLYEYKRPNDLTVLAEAGASNGLGFAFRAERLKGRNQYRHSLRYKASQFAGLPVDSSRGLIADGTLNRPLGGRFQVRTNYYVNRYTLPQFRQTNVGGGATLNYLANEHWTFAAGAAYAHLKPETPAGDPVETKSLPLGVDFRSKYLSAGYQHMFTRNTGQDLGGRQDRVTLGTGWGTWRVNAFWDRQTQAPTANFIVSETPGLRDVIERLGLAATSAEQIAQLMQQDAVLLQLGYLSAIRVNLAPVRTQAGGSLVWAGHGALSPQLSASFLYNDNQQVVGGSRSQIGTLSAVWRLPGQMDLFASWSLFGSSTPGTRPERRSQVDVSLRRRFGGAPDWLFPTRGNVSGRVFEDDHQRGEWQPGARPLEDVVVVLDGARQTRTSRDGRFRFTGVPSGTHRVEVLFESSRPFYFTTPSRNSVTPNSQADFGIAYATSVLFGYVLNDAGAGIPAIQVTAAGSGRSWETATDADGKFSLSGLRPAEYEVTLSAESFPPGYTVADLEAQRVQVHSDAPGRVEFKVRASRALAGIVTVYDRALTRQVPVEGVVVRIRELGLQTTTGKDGAYVFRNLPAGDFTIVAVYDGREFTRTEHLAAEPLFTRNADISVGAR